MDIISVVVPVYNVKNYLDRCVESIVSQTYHGLEIILVDDGSTDSSGEMCDDWARKDSRIVVIHKENGGLSDARNAGMKIAKGDYIGFVDSDDWIDVRMYEILYYAIKRNGTNLALCQYKEVADKDVYETRYDEKEFFFTGRSLLRHIFERKKDPYVNNSVWKFLYKKSLVEGLSFPKGRLYEDVIFTTRALWEEERVVVCSQQLYFYRKRDDSIMHKMLSDKNIDDIFAYSDGLIEFYNKNATNEEMAYLKESLLWNNLAFRSSIRVSSNDIKLIDRLDNYRKENDLSYSNIDDKNLKNFVKYFLCKGPRLYCLIYESILKAKRQEP